MPVIELLVSGVLLGGIYALIACGLNLIFGVMRVINFAHGELVAISALAAVSMVTTLKLPFWAAVATLPFAMAAVGWLMQNMVLRKLEGMPPIMSLLATYAISTILVNAAILVWGGGYMPESVSPGARMLGLVCFVASCPFNLTAWEMTSPNSMALDRRNRELVGDLFGLACNCPTPQPRGQAIFMDP